MAGKRPPNAEATQFRSGDEAVKNGRKGGLKSGKNRQENKKIQKILLDFLNTDARASRYLASRADLLGLDDSATVKELVVIMMLLNTLKKGDLSDLERLMRLLGEQKETAGAEEKLDALLAEFVKATREDTNDT